jgi:hypothetical protein
VPGSRRTALFIVICAFIVIVVLIPGWRLRNLSRNELLAWTRKNATAPASPYWADWRDVCPQKQRTPDPPIFTTLCGVLKNPGQFACKRIMFRATVSSDCLEHTALVDSSCGLGVDPFGPDSPALERLWLKGCEHSRNGRIDFDRRTSGTFTGVFLWWHSAPSDRFAVRVEDVAAIRIEPLR